MMKATLLALFGSLLVSSCGGGSGGGIQCDESSNCNQHPGGSCDVNPATGNKWCSYPDPDCASGRRWSDLDTGDGISGKCTAPSDIDASVDGSIADAGDDASSMPDAMRSDGGGPITTKLTASDGEAGDGFGVVGISGDTIVVGAPGDDDVAQNAGAAYIFVWNSTSSKWEPAPTPKVTADDGASGDGFGFAVAIDGGHLVVSNHPPSGGTPSAAYVFEQTIDGFWIQSKKLTSGNTYDTFGSSVAISGSTILVGAEGDDEAAAGAGAVYIFEREAGVWQPGPTPKLIAPDAAMSRSFGRSVAIDGTHAAVGSPGTENTATYLYEKNTTDSTWAAAATARISGSSGHYYGGAVDLDGDDLVIASNDIATSDVLHLYRRNTSTGQWLAATVPSFTPSDGQHSDAFGTSVALDGSQLVAGSPGNDQAGADAGAVYFLTDSGSGSWGPSTTPKVTAFDPAAADQFGLHVAADGGRVVVGSPGDTSGAGAIYVY